jgi:hypothetical protein
MSSDVRVVVSTDNDDNEVKIAVLRPKAKHLREAQLSYNRAFRDALESGALLRQKLEDHMREQGIWDDVKQKRYDEVNATILGGEKKLAKGGISLSQAKTLALDMRMARGELRELIAERTIMDGNTAEGQADNARFNALVSECIVSVDNNNVKRFDNVEDYDTVAAEPWAIEAASQLANMLYDLDPNYDKNLPENKFLQDYKFIDKELRLVNDDEHLVDFEGRLINEEGRFIAYDDDGEVYFIDREGSPLTEEGDYAVEFEPFLDDSGDPIDKPELKEEESKSETTTATKKKTTKKKKVVEEELEAED